MSNIHEPGEWPRDFTEVTMTVLKTPKVSKCGERRPLSLIAYTTKTVAGYLEEVLKEKSRMCLQKISLDVEEERKLEMQKR